MGACMSSPGEGCAGGRLKPRRRPRRRIRVSRRRLWSRKTASMETIPEGDGPAGDCAAVSDDGRRSYGNPVFRGERKVN